FARFWRPAWPASAACTRGRLKPNSPAPPACSSSRRVGPLHWRRGLPRIVSMIVLPSSIGIGREATGGNPRLSPSVAASGSVGEEKSDFLGTGPGLGTGREHCAPDGSRAARLHFLGLPGI